MSHTESDRKAFYSDKAKQAEKEAVAKWLSENPEIGVLNGGQFYAFKNGFMVNVAKFEKI